MSDEADVVQTGLIRGLQRSVVKLQTDLTALRLQFDKMEAELHVVGKQKQHLIVAGDELLNCVANKERNESDSQAIASWRTCKSIVASLKKSRLKF